MGRFDRGINYYTKGKAVIDVSFPEDAVCCQYCRFCRTETELKRYWCRLTNEMIYNPFSPYRGEKCPVVFEGEGDRHER